MTEQADRYNYLEKRQQELSDEMSRIHSFYEEKIDKPLRKLDRTGSIRFEEMPTAADYENDRQSVERLVGLAKEYTSVTLELHKLGELMCSEAENF